MRDKEFKCVYCGRFIAYKDIPKRVGRSYTPDTDYTNERMEMWHKKCEELPPHPHKRRKG